VEEKDDEEKNIEKEERRDIEKREIDLKIFIHNSRNRNHFSFLPISALSFSLYNARRAISEFFTR